MKAKTFYLLALTIMILTACSSEKTENNQTTSQPVVVDSLSNVPVADESEKEALLKAKQALLDSLQSDVVLDSNMN
jgi:uncharacterized protein YcfL